MMLAQILMHTPKWVFVLFATLVWLGAKQLLAGTVGLARVTLLPVAMTGLSIFGVASAFGESSSTFMAWGICALALLAFVARRPLPASTRYDAATRQFHMAGSAVPLVLMMGIFFTKYVVGVLLAMHPELRHDTAFSLGLCALYGAFSGIFTGRTVRLWKLAIRADRGGVATSAAQA